MLIEKIEIGCESDLLFAPSEHSPPFHIMSEKVSARICGREGSRYGRRIQMYC